MSDEERRQIISQILQNLLTLGLILEDEETETEHISNPLHSSE